MSSLESSMHYDAKKYDRVKAKYHDHHKKRTQIEAQILELEKQVAEALVEEKTTRT